MQIFLDLILDTSELMNLTISLKVQNVLLDPLFQILSLIFVISLWLATFSVVGSDFVSVFAV